MSFARIYPLYVAKVERKGRSRDDLDRVVSWLTGYDKSGLQREETAKCNTPNRLPQS